MLDTIVKKGIPFGILMALAGVAVDVYFQGALEYKFNAFKFVGVSILGGGLIGIILHFLQKRN